MNKYLAAFSKMMDELDEQANTVESPHQRSILRSFIHHLALERTQEEGRWREVFLPQNIVENPVYHLRLGASEVVTLRGCEEIEKHYAENRDPDHPAGGSRTAIMFDARVAVSDWGFACFCTSAYFVTAEQVRYMNLEADDPLGTYVVEQPLAMFWYYDVDARLIGEDVFAAGPQVAKRIDPDEAVTNLSRSLATDRFLPPKPDLASA